MRRSYGISAIAAAAALLGMSFQAGAMAPVISELPSPIIGNEAIASPPNAFVYPDAFNLDSYVTDDVTTDGAIIWSYENAGGRYSINGVDPLDGGNPNSPGTARLDTQDLDSGAADANARTITLRDTVFSPEGGPNVDPGTTGIVANEIVMLFASDGTTYSMKEMAIYTDNGGEDRLSSSGTQEQFIDFLTAAPTTDWVTSLIAGGQTATFSNLAGQGLCIQVALGTTPGTAVVGNWISPYGFISLASQKVYRIRTQVNGGNIAAGVTPLWGLTVDNFNTANAAQQRNKYGQEYFILDNVGGANNANGGVQYDFWFTPAPVLADDWNNPTTGVFTAAYEDFNDARVVFRIVQAAGSGYGGENDQGRLCLEQIELTSFDINSLAIESSDYSTSNLAGATHFVTVLASVPAGATSSFAGGNVTITPPGGGWSVALVQVTPGNANPGYPGNLAEAQDNYPVTDTNQGLYRVQIGAQAPNAAAETLPVDAVRIGADDSTNEVLSTSNVLNSVDQLGMPKAGSPTLYTMFYQSGNITLDGTAGAGLIRPRVDILCVPEIGAGNPGNNPNGITFTSMAMEKVNAPN